jgi:spermidine synthase
MRPWIHLDTANVPGDKTQLKLMQRGEEFSIMLGTNELMNSRLSGSEEALATLSAERIGARAGAKVLIGGLGMGFTLRAAQKCFPADCELVIAELVPEIIAWARGPLTPVFENCLDDPRVSIINDDVGKIIAAGNRSYDAILLDVDNGPDGVSQEQNDALYGPAGLKKSFAALKPGGVLAVWSAHPSAPFTKRLRGANFTVEEVNVRARSSGRGARHVIWLGVKPGAAG